MNQRRITLLTVVVLVLAGQLNINIIVHGFTISMSIVFFLLFSFLLTDFQPFYTAVLAAPLLVLTRGCFAWISGAELLESIISFMPEAIFLLLYGAMFSIYMKKVSCQTFAIIKFIPLVGIDFCSNLVEIYIRLGHSGITLDVLGKLLIIAIGRTTIAVTLVALLNHYGEFMIRKEEQQRYQKLLLLIANLKSEVIWMNKNTKDIENITANAYDIYQHVKENGNHDYQVKSLELAKDIHEIKKEYFLIMRGINEVLEEEDSSDKMKISYLLQTVQESLGSHYLSANQQIEIKIMHACEHLTDKHYCILSILRNLVTNAIEAGENQDQVVVIINAREEEQDIILSVEDNCGGIDEEDFSEIFKPGFSTKIDYEKGSTGRGLGLCIVKDLVETTLGGTLEVEVIDIGTRFVIRIPKENLI